MKTATSMKLLTAGLCLWATVAVVSSAEVDSASIDRMINIAVSDRKNDDPRGTQEQYKAALEAQRPCLAESLGTVDPESLRLVLEIDAAGLACLSIELEELEDFTKMGRCLQALPRISKEEEKAVQRAFDKCDPDAQSADR